MIRMENWSVCYYPTDPYGSPEQCTAILRGQVYGHPRFSEGQNISTSSIVGKIDDKVATASGSVYILGEVDPNYEKLFPNARKRLFESLLEVGGECL